MKLAFIFLVIFGLESSAKGVAQEVSLSLNNASCKVLFKEIHKQTGISFFYNSESLRNVGNITINEKHVAVETVLKKYFENKNTYFSIVNGSIVIYNRVENKDPDLTADIPPAIVVRGRITDENGQPLEGATISIKGSKKAAVTDVNGDFTLEIPDNSVVLAISYVGYETIEISAKNRTNFNLSLKQSNAVQQDVVIVGYGTQKKVNLTGAVAVVDKKTLQNRPVISISQMLQGAVPGLTVTTGNTGQPGSTPAIRLRGQGSLTNGGATPPYILIDGVQSSESQLMNLNPDDVESISVLKDAAASAIYGANAAFGVILITTKSGSGQLNKLQVNYSNNFDFAAFTVIPDMVNTIQFADAYNDGYDNAKVVRMFTDEWMQKAKARIADPTLPATEAPTKLGFYRNFDSWDNVDWYHEMFKSGFSAFQQKHTLSLSGTTDKINYYVSAGYRDNVSNIRYGNWLDRQYSGLMRFNAKVSKWLDMGLNFRYGMGLVEQPTGNNDGEGTYMIFHNMWRSWPMQFLKDPNGHWNDITNIPWLIDGGQVATTTNEFTITPNFVIKPLPGWKINFDYTLQPTLISIKKNLGNVPQWLYDGTIWPATWNNRQANTYAYKQATNNNYYTFNLYSSYEKNIKDHHFGVTGGVQQSNSYNRTVWGKRMDVLYSDLPVINLSNGTQYAGDGESKWATLGFFGRANYNYKEKYLFELDGRYDGSAKFRESHRWGFFPSASLGYVFSKEKFWDNLRSTINFAKLRLSYGSVGNQNVSNFTYLPTMSYGQAGVILNGVRPYYVNAPGLISPDLTWEEARTANLGFDLGLLNNRLTVGAEVYKRKTLNMFGPAIALPAVLGTGVPQMNNAALSTKGYELTLQWKDRIGELNYGITGILTDYQTRIDDYLNPTGILSSWAPGRKLGEIWGYQTDRYFTEDDFNKDANDNYVLKSGIPSQAYFYSKWSPGDVKYKDTNGDDAINPGKNTLADHGDLTVIGNSTPRYQYSFVLDLQYKGFDLRAFFQGVGKQDIWYNDVTFWGFDSRAQSNFTIQQLDYWTPTRTNAYYPKPYLQGDNNGKNRQAQTKYLLNAAYCRLKNLQLGYNIPKSFLGKIGLESLKVYASGENLFTFTKFPVFYDVEAYGKTHPMQKHLSFGLNASF